MRNVVIYGFPQSTYVRTARMCLHEKGVDYALEPVDLGSDDYRALHPFAKVPAFRHGDVRLYETVAIARYVDGAFDGPDLTPADVVDAARMSQWISVVIDYVYPTLIGKVVLERFAPAIRGRDADEAVITEALPQVEYQLGVLDAALAGPAMLAGDTPTIADFFVAPILFYAAITPDTAALVEARPNLVRWHTEMAERASYQDTIPQLPTGN
jgi:glutathione S-transferase